MRKYAIKIGEIHAVTDEPISPELRKAILEAVRRVFYAIKIDEIHVVTDEHVSPELREAMLEFDTSLGTGAEIEFRLEKA